MVYRVRHVWWVALAIFVATVAGWFIGFIQLIYMMPIFALQAIMVSFACPRCNQSPFVRRLGYFRYGGWPTKTCSNCGFDFVARPANQ